MSEIIPILTSDFWLVSVLPAVITSTIIGAFTSITNYFIMKRFLNREKKCGCSGK